jgi:hypothetical protein
VKRLLRGRASGNAIANPLAYGNKSTPKSLAISQRHSIPVRQCPSCVVGETGDKAGRAGSNCLEILLGHADTQYLDRLP